MQPEIAPEKPVPPEDWECCGSECGDACIQEIYRREKAVYDAWLAEQAQKAIVQARDDGE